VKQVDLDRQTILITGAAGFIGSSLVKRLLEYTTSAVVVGVDNMNDYYDPILKAYRLAGIEWGTENGRFVFHKTDVADGEAVQALFDQYRPGLVVHLAAQAGVRYSIVNPDSYIRSNLVGFYNVLESCRKLGDGLRHLVYASSSSVYGESRKVPFSVSAPTDAPVSLYAATKKSNELLAHSYAALYGLPSTGLRFFTVYGPAGRPDMAYFSFTEKLLRGEKISLFNYGNCARDFTYIDDIVEGIVKVMQGPPAGEEGDRSRPPCAVYNIGNSQPVGLTDFVQILSEELVRAGLLPRDFDIEAHKTLLPMQPGDVPVTYADTSELEKQFGFRPSTALRTGLRKFAEWYRAYYGEQLERPFARA